MIITDLKYDASVEVSKEQYLMAKVKYAGIIAHRKENGKYYIKLWFMQYKDKLIKDLNENN